MPLAAPKPRTWRERKARDIARLYSAELRLMGAAGTRDFVARVAAEDKELGRALEAEVGRLAPPPV